MAPLSWTISSGALPPGLKLSVTKDGFVSIHGYPTTVTAGKSYAFAVRAVDSKGAQDERAMSITVKSNLDQPRWLRLKVYVIAYTNSNVDVPPPPFSLYVDGKLVASGLTYMSGGTEIQREVIPTDDGVYRVTVAFNDGAFWDQESSHLEASAVVEEKYLSIDSWIISKVTGYRTLSQTGRSFSFEAPFVTP